MSNKIDFHFPIKSRIFRGRYGLDVEEFIRDFPNFGMVYQYYNKADELIYVGFTGYCNVKSRDLAHKKEKEWWLEIAKKEEEYFEHFDDAYFHEQMRIAMWEPKYNFACEKLTWNSEYARAIRKSQYERKGKTGWDRTSF